AEAVAKANQRLEELSKKQNVNFKIETILLTDAEKQKYDKASAETKAKHFKEWATDRFTKLGLGERGGFVLVVKTPSQVQTHLGQEADKAFGPDGGHQLAQQLAKDLTTLKGASRDGALDNLVSSVATGAGKLPPATTVSNSSGTTGTTA